MQTSVTGAAFPPTEPAQLASTRPAFFCVSIAKIWYLVGLPGTFLVIEVDVPLRAEPVLLRDVNRLLATDWPGSDATGRARRPSLTPTPGINASGFGQKT